MRVGAKYVSKSDIKDYIIITKVDKTTCCYDFFTKGGARIGDVDAVVSKTVVNAWGILANPKIKY